MTLNLLRNNADGEWTVRDLVAEFMSKVKLPRWEGEGMMGMLFWLSSVLSVATDICIYTSSICLSTGHQGPQGFAMALSRMRIMNSKKKKLSISPYYGQGLKRSRALTRPTGGPALLSAGLFIQVELNWIEIAARTEPYELWRGPNNGGLGPSYASHRA